MFSNLVTYLIGSSNVEEADRVEESTVRLSSRISDDDWVLVDRDSEGNSEVSSDEEESVSDRLDELLDVPRPKFPRSSSTSSLPCASMEDSWFITPPPSFTSAGPIQLETSPFENLLIEHPSMSVYNQHSHPVFTGRRHSSVPAAQQSDNSIRGKVGEDVLREESEEEFEEVLVAVQTPRRNLIETYRQQERQNVRNKQAQKVLLHLSARRLSGNELFVCRCRSKRRPRY